MKIAIIGLDVCIFWSFFLKIAIDSRKDALEPPEQIFELEDCFVLYMTYANQRIVIETITL